MTRSTSVDRPTPDEKDDYSKLLRRLHTLGYL